MNRTLLRKITAGALIIFVSTFLVLLARNYNWGPERKIPGFRIKGAENAKIVIEEYTDFACPACAAVNETIKELMKAFDGKILLRFKYYPLLPRHKWSFEAALYSECAGKQGKFFEYADSLFKNQKKWGYGKNDPKKEFEKYAKELNLNMNKLVKCLKEPKTEQSVILDMSEGRMRGINATPTFFINGKRAVGSAQLADRAKKFESLLKNEKK